MGITYQLVSHSFLLLLCTCQLQGWFYIYSFYCNCFPNGDGCGICLGKEKKNFCVLFFYCCWLSVYMNYWNLSFYLISGGYNIKTGPGCSIELMKFDMGGSAAVLGAAKAIGQIKPSGVEVINLIFFVLMWCNENCPDWSFCTPTLSSWIL